MGAYRIQHSTREVDVRHTAVFPFLMGCASLLGGLTGLALWASEMQGAGGLNYWVPPLICAGLVSGGIYLTNLPTQRRIRFVAGTDRLEISDRRLMNTHTSAVSHKGLNTLMVRRTDNDGYWYTPVIAIENGELVEIGFGCPTEESAQQIIDDIRNRMESTGTA